ncbi:hypothetical protein ACFQT0_13450 [Hymenobacter humi]|uniref:TRAP transporter small permease subunit n=1 Tax=Hymenobacter humi TaxID=1411620 RepID=A0ABW2U747_9BACT
MAQPKSTPQFTGGYLPISGSWVSKWKALQVLLLISVVLTVVLNPQSLTDAKRLAITFAITFAYSAGLWFVNGYGVDWLNRRVSWVERPLRRLLLTLVVSIGGSMVVILLIQVAFLLLMGEPMAMLWSPRMYGQVLVPLGVTTIISLFNHSRSFFQQWREAAVRVERLERKPPWPGSTPCAGR